MKNRGENNSTRKLIVISMLVLLIPIGAFAGKPQETKRGPLAEVPTPPGPHVAKIKALKAGE